MTYTGTWTARFETPNVYTERYINTPYMSDEELMQITKQIAEDTIALKFVTEMRKQGLTDVVVTSYQATPQVFVTNIHQYRDYTELSRNVAVDITVSFEGTVAPSLAVGKLLLGAVILAILAITGIICLAWSVTDWLKSMDAKRSVLITKEIDENGNVIDQTQTDVTPPPYDFLPIVLAGVAVVGVSLFALYLYRRRKR